MGRNRSQWTGISRSEPPLCRRSRPVRCRLALRAALHCPDPRRRGRTGILAAGAGPAGDTYRAARGPHRAAAQARSARGPRAAGIRRPLGDRSGGPGRMGQGPACLSRQRAENRGRDPGTVGCGRGDRLGLLRIRRHSAAGDTGHRDCLRSLAGGAGPARAGGRERAGARPGLARRLTGPAGT